MIDRTRRHCPRCEAVTAHWRDGAPLPRDPRFVLVALLVRLAWPVVSPWQCRECGRACRPWSRR